MDSSSHTNIIWGRFPNSVPVRCSSAIDKDGHEDHHAGKLDRLGLCSVVVRLVRIRRAIRRHEIEKARELICRLRQVVGQCTELGLASLLNGLLYEFEAECHHVEGDLQISLQSLLVAAHHYGNGPAALVARVRRSVRQTQQQLSDSGVG